LLTPASDTLIGEVKTVLAFASIALRNGVDRDETKSQPQRSEESPRTRRDHAGRSARSNTELPFGEWATIPRTTSWAILNRPCGDCVIAGADRSGMNVAIQSSICGNQQMRSWGLRPIVFGPGTPWRTWGTRPIPSNSGYDTDSCGTERGQALRAGLLSAVPAGLTS
jgi:hypothetical protein